jgi:phage terminase large subunit
MAYEPYEPNSYEIMNETDLWYDGKPISDINEPPPHPKNVANGTADKFMWMVYGLGLRGAMKGVIFQNVKYIEKDEVPDYGHSYGCDFGFTNDPTALTRCWEDEYNIFVELLCYSPIDNPEDLGAMFEACEVEYDVPITCDSSDKYTGENKGTVEMVGALREMGYQAFKVSKTKGIMFWLSSMKKKRLNIVKNHLSHFAKRELENYKFKEINGMCINQPIDKFNHMIDSIRYNHIAYNNSNINLVSEWE